VLAPLFFQSAESGAWPTLRAATDPSVEGGQYYGPNGFAEQRGHPKLVQPAPSPTTKSCSVGSGGCPKYSPA
jgi:hypothetical protein